MLGGVNRRGARPEGERGEQGSVEQKNCWPVGPTNDVVAGGLSRPAGPGWWNGWPFGPEADFPCRAVASCWV